MRKVWILTGLMSVAILAAGCKDTGKSEGSKPGTPISLKVTGASGKVLEEGAVVGVIASKPVWSDNVSCTVSAGGKLVADSEMSWGAGQTSSSVLLAYRPYNADYTGKDKVIFEMPADQSTTAKMKEADLQIGIISGSPTSSDLTLGLSHRMCAVQVTFDVCIPDEIKSVSVSGFTNRCELDLLTGNVTPTGTNVQITPCRSTKGGDTYMFIIPPQSSTPRYTVTMKSGKIYAFTYLTPISPLPGTVISRDDIAITDETDAATILGGGTSLSKWSVNGIPSFPSYDTPITISEISSVKVNTLGMFNATLANVAVTHIDQVDGTPLGVILDDGTAAVYAWLAEGQTLSEGQTISGTVSGIMYFPEAGGITINGLDVSGCKVTNGGKLPVMERTFEQVAAGIDTMQYRRVLFKGVTMESGFDIDHATFSQGGKEMQVICYTDEIDLMKGAVGDIIGFPIMFGSTPAILTNPVTSFENFSIPEYQGPFGDIQECGIYDLSDPQSPKPLYSDAQVSIRVTIDDIYSMQVADYSHNRAVNVYTYKQAFRSGHTVLMDVTAFGEENFKYGVYDVGCVKATEEKGWLIDSENGVGFILPVEL